MPFDSSHTPAKGGLAASAMAGVSARRDASHRGPAGAAEDLPDPRIVTRGSFSTNTLKHKRKPKAAAASHPELADLLSWFFFDWFQVTLPNKDGKASCEVGSDVEAEAIDAAFDWCGRQGLHPGRVGSGHNGYRAALPWMRSAESKEVLCRVNSGSSSGIMPNVMLTGGHGACAELAPRLQSAFPGARLSRADAALDWSQEGLWEGLLDMAKTLARANTKLGGVRTIESEQGRTFYLGSPASTVSLRVYEKDRERAARGVIDEADVDPDLIRIEWTFRPQSKSKAGMSGKAPGEMIRTSVWARDFMARAAKIMHVTDRVEKIHREEVEREVTEKTLSGTVQHGVDQYAKSFARLAAVQIVERDHEGHFDTAVLTPEEVEAEALVIFQDRLERSGASSTVIEEERLDRALDPDAWRASYVHELMKAPGEIEKAAQKQQGRMMGIAQRKGFSIEEVAS